MKRHGDPSMYRYYGCRCQECKAAAAAQTRALAQRKRQEIGPTPAEQEAMTGLPGENWLPAVGFPGYEVSSLGRVRSTKFTYPRLVSAIPSKNGYLRVQLWAGNKSRFKFIHGLVLEAFVGPYPEGQEARHLNDIKTDNRLENLAYGTHAENMQDWVRNGRRRKSA